MSESIHITIFQAPYASLMESGTWAKIYKDDEAPITLPAQYYLPVFNGRITADSRNPYNVLETAFELFNIGERPAGYCGRSMSVGDVIKLDGKYYLCRTVGFQECGFAANDPKFPQPKPKMDAEKIKKAEQVLIDNGIDPDEAQTVLQALGYVLLDEELYPDSDLTSHSDLQVVPNLDAIEKSYGFVNDGTNAYLLLGLASPVRGPTFAPYGKSCVGAYVIKVMNTENIPTGPVKIAVWSSNQAFWLNNQPVSILDMSNLVKDDPFEC